MMHAQTTTVYRVLLSISLVHLLNDSMQAVIPAVLPILKNSLTLTYTQLGIILFVMNATAALLQPLVGLLSDRHPRPFLLPAGMLASGLGMLGIALAEHYLVVLLSVALVGIGSAIFHPEASRVAYLASGSRRGLGQSIFQVGGNTGQTMAPLLTALIFVPLGQSGAAWFVITAGIALAVLVYVAFWYSAQQQQRRGGGAALLVTHLSSRRIALFLLIVIVSVRSCVYAGLQGFYPLYLIDVSGYDMALAQWYVFIFLLAGAIGTLLGGPLADRFGKRTLLIISTVGSLPFSVLIPFVQGAWAYPLLFCVGIILLSSFSVAIVYAQELLPGKIGTVSGLILGFSFGMGGIGAYALGKLADGFGLFTVILLCGILPVVGLLGFLLPSDKRLELWTKQAAQHA